VNKPVKKTYTKITEYWDCGLGTAKGHKHTTEKIATTCLEKRKHSKSWPARKKENQELKDKIMDEWLKHKNFSAAGRLFGVNQQRARDIVRGHRKFYEYHGCEWIYPSLIQCIEVLKEWNIISLDDAISFIDSFDVDYLEKLWPEIPYIDSIDKFADAFNKRQEQWDADKNSSPFDDFHHFDVWRKRIKFWQTQQELKTAGVEG